VFLFSSITQGASSATWHIGKGQTFTGQIRLTSANGVRIDSMKKPPARSDVRALDLIKTRDSAYDI
jgi:hypothetical protein